MTVLESLALLNLIAVVIIHGKPWIMTKIAISLAAGAATAKYGCFARRHQCNDKEVTDPPAKRTG